MITEVKFGFEEYNIKSIQERIDFLKEKNDFNVIYECIKDVEPFFHKGEKIELNGANCKVPHAVNPYQVIVVSFPWEFFLDTKYFKTIKGKEYSEIKELFSMLHAAKRRLRNLSN